tara:strand:- start:39108 stop:40931 length:1824 start_codon:yes stop_codon:yes gene_type:complete
MRTIGNDLSAKKQNNFIASGTLDNGASVIVNADGTVSSVVQTAFTSADGNVTENSSVSGSYDFTACYDSTNKRVVAFYNRSDSLVAQVGSISGTTITFLQENVITYSTPAEMNCFFIPPTASRNAKIGLVYRLTSGSTGIKCNICEITDGTGTLSYINTSSSTNITSNGRYPRAAYDPDNDLVVIMYRNQSNGNCVALSCNFTGTGLSTAVTVPGSEQTIKNQFLSSDAGKFFITYDTNANRFVFIYFDGSTGYPRSKVGFVNTPASGAMTMGSEVTIESSAMSGPYYGNIIYDPDQKKVILLYRTSGGGGKIIAGTVSGTSITWGTAVAVDGSMTTANLVYDSQAKKVLVLYMNTSNNYGRIREVTVNGTTLTVGSESVPLSQDLSTTTQFGLAHDSDQNVNYVTFRKSSSGGRFAAMCIRLAHLSENLTSENFIGMPESRVANSATATVKTQGAIAKNAFNNGYVITVQNVSGNNKYFIDGVQQDTLTLYRGNTYFFDWSAASTHPFSFSTTSDGTHNSGSEYTTGVTKDNSAYTTSITVDSSAPNTLYYYCSAHSGMGGSATISNVIPGRTYYVQKNGILKTTADTPSVVAGTALSTTELIVKG